jgi:hypothetical protein
MELFWTHNVISNIVFVVEVRRIATANATNRCPPSSPPEEAKILHVNM